MVLRLHSPVLLAVLLIAGAIGLFIAVQPEAAQTAQPVGDAAICADLRGDAARACYRREIGAQLARNAGREFDDAATTASVEFAVTTGDDALLCDLHARVGSLDPQAPSWLGWTTPLT